MGLLGDILRVPGDIVDAVGGVIFGDDEDE